MRHKVINPGSETLLLASTIMGGRLYGKDGTDGDAIFRAEWCAKEIGCTALVTDRINPGDVEPRKRIFTLGLPKSLEPKEYTQRAAADAKGIARLVEDLKPRRIISFDASAGASHRLKMISTELHPIADETILFDPNAIQSAARPFPRLSSFGRWAGYQISREVFRPKEAKNQHPMAHLDASDVSVLQELSYFGNEWTTDFAYSVLQNIAAGRINVGSNNHVIFPEISFTQSTILARERATTLNQLALDNHVTLSAITLPGMRHSATDDPAICTNIVKTCIV